MPAGRPRKYKTKEEAYQAKLAKKRERNRRKREEKGGISWLSEKFEPAPKPSERSGDPFADLPPLDLPIAPSTGSDTSTTATDSPTSTAAASDSFQSGQTTSETNSTTPGSTEPPKQQIDTEEMARWAEIAYVKGLREGNEYLKSIGGWECPDFLITTGGKGFAFIIRKYASELGISTEDAAWASFLTPIAVEGGSLYFAKKAQKEAEKAKHGTVIEVKPLQGAPTNGNAAGNGAAAVQPEPQPEQRTQSAVPGSIPGYA